MTTGSVYMSVVPRNEMADRSPASRKEVAMTDRDRTAASRKMVE
jgi:hypothetical protein